MFIFYLFNHVILAILVPCSLTTSCPSSFLSYASPISRRIGLYLRNHTIVSSLLSYASPILRCYVIYLLIHVIASYLSYAIFVSSRLWYLWNHRHSFLSPFVCECNLTTFGVSLASDLSTHSSSISWCSKRPFLGTLNPLGNKSTRRSSCPFRA